MGSVASVTILSRRLRVRRLLLVTGDVCGPGRLPVSAIVVYFLPVFSRPINTRLRINPIEKRNLTGFVLLIITHRFTSIHTATPSFYVVSWSTARCWSRNKLRSPSIRVNVGGRCIRRLYLIFFTLYVYA